ncbi:MAG: SDR family oxidoreductase [Balneolaceae bacterium]|nr:SDR family oxidoreductase [Balneolaceae bacterium]
MSNKLCLVTGANSGIGKATAKKLAEKGLYVIMLCRSEQRAEKAREDIINQTGNSSIEIILADLSLQHDIRQAAREVNDRFDQLDLLINNAGFICSSREETPEGIEKTFAVNHLAPFLFTNLLLDPLKAAPEARVVNVSSEAHRTVSSVFNLGNLQLQKQFSPMKAYGLSKLCNIMFTRELARRTADTSVTTNALHPGVTRTNLTDDASWLMHLLFTIGKPFMKSPERGAKTSVYLATSDEVKEISGAYFKNKKKIKPAKIALDDELCRKLWKKSAELTNLN